MAETMTLVETERFYDCLEHSTHHVMTQECWSAWIELYVDLQCRGVPEDQIRDRAKAIYEAAVLRDLLR